MSCAWRLALGVCAWAFAVQANGAPESVPKGPVETVLRCEVNYLPERSTWVREVVLVHDARALRAVRIDGVAVYTFNVAGTVVLTSLDNERIQIDVARPGWTSNFRDLATGQGGCERQP
jgi:hypothetical protein